MSNAHSAQNGNQTEHDSAENLSSLKGIILSDTVQINPHMLT